MIFEADELDEDEEIPLPYRFEKRKKQLLKAGAVDGDPAEPDRQFDIDSILEEEDAKIEVEFQKLQDLSRHSSVDSLMADMPIKLGMVDEEADEGNEQKQVEDETRKSEEVS